MIVFSQVSWSHSLNRLIAVYNFCSYKCSCTHLYGFLFDFVYRRRHQCHRKHLEESERARSGGGKYGRVVEPFPCRHSCKRPGVLCMYKNECKGKCTGKTSASCNNNPRCFPWLAPCKEQK